MYQSGYENTPDATTMGCMSTPIQKIPVRRITGEDTNLGEYSGKVLLVVNVASKCGLTKQYEALEKLYRDYRDRGLVVVGFPANDFKAQEPGTNEEIKTFCSSKYNVTFPMYAKVSVKGADITPLYKFLTETKGGDVKWNFTKFLADKHGNVIARFEPNVTPDSPELVSAVEAALKK